MGEERSITGSSWTAEEPWKIDLDPPADATVAEYLRSHPPTGHRVSATLPVAEIMDELMFRSVSNAWNHNGIGMPPPIMLPCSTQTSYLYPFRPYRSGHPPCGNNIFTETFNDGTNGTSRPWVWNRLVLQDILPARLTPSTTFTMSGLSPSHLSNSHRYCFLSISFMHIYSEMYMNGVL